MKPANFRLSRLAFTFVLSLWGILFSLGAYAQVIASTGMNAVIPGSAYRNLIGQDFVDFGIGFYADNQFFVHDKIALKYEGSYSFLIGQGNLRADHTHFGVGSNFYFRPEGYIIRPYAGMTVGLDFLMGRFFFANALQAGVFFEFSEQIGLDLSARYRMGFGEANLFFFEPRLGLVVNFDYF